MPDARFRLTIALLVALGMSADPAALAADQTPDQVLTSRGLKRSGLLYVLDAESEFIPKVAKLQPSFRQLKGQYDKLAAIAQNQAQYDQLNDEWTLVTERLSNVQAEIGAHPVLSNSELKQNWQNLLEAERQLQYRYSELRREVNLRYPRLVSDFEKGKLQAEFLKQREDFLEKSRELRTLSDKIKEDYGTLSRDAAVKKALDAQKVATKTRTALGPSQDYKKASTWLTNAVKSTAPESLITKKQPGARKGLKDKVAIPAKTPGKGVRKGTNEANPQSSGEPEVRPY